MTGNNQLPDDVAPDLVFDHHPPRRTTQQSPFVDIRPDYGATATILAEYLMAAEVPIGKRDATALVYAIRTETQDFGRQYARADKEVYDGLHSTADLRALAKIQSPPLPETYYRTLHEALEHVESVETLVVSHVGQVAQPDIVPEIADLLLRLKGKTWSFATGFFEDRLYLSIRTTNPRADAGRLMRRLLGKRGKGGGHGMMAGGWIKLPTNGGGSPQRLQASRTSRLAKYLKKNPERLAPLILDES